MKSSTRPSLLPYVKEQVDAHRDRPGQFILTGSQNLLLMQQVTESLAGRSAVLKLLPMSQREVARRPDRPLPWETGHPARRHRSADLPGALGADPARVLPRAGRQPASVIRACGRPATCRPTWSGTCATCAMSAT